jgi:hypothetical protein
MSRQRGWLSTEWPATTRQIRNFSSGSGWPQPDPRKVQEYPGVFAGDPSTEVLAAGTPANEPYGLVTESRGGRILLAVEAATRRYPPAAKAETNVVIASLVLCMVLILLSAAGAQNPQKVTVKRPRN